MALHDISGTTLKDLFVRRESAINLRYKPELVILSVNSVLKGKNSLRYFVSVIWNLMQKQKLEKIIRFCHL